MTPTRALPAGPDPFASLHGGDPHMQRNVATTLKVLDRDIPCLLLGLSRNTLYRRMKRHGINPAR